MAKSKTSTIAIVFTSLNIGGIERKIIDLCHYYSSHPNIKAVLLLKTSQGQFISQIPNNIKISTLTNHQRKYHNFLFPFWLAYQFFKLKPKLIISFGNFSSICAIIGNTLSAKTPLIISEDSSIDLQIKSDSFSFIRQLLIGFTYPLATKIIVLTSSAKQKIIKFVDSQKVVILPNWLPLNLSSPQHNIPRNNDILFVGRLTPQKDPLKFLHICRRLVSKVPNLTITMIGEGPLLPAVKKYISTHSLPISLLPADSNVGHFYQISKLFLLTSRHEGFPLTILESFSQGCPAISPALPEISPFYSKNPETFLYSNKAEAVRIISKALSDYSKLIPITKKYTQYVNSSQQQNFNDTVKYFESFL
jgi:glycosyltransferase involved in cell wall biosynthesis